MDSSALTVVLLVAGVGVAAWLLRSFSSRAAENRTQANDAAAVEALISGEEFAADEDEHAGEIIAVTSDGWAFVPSGHAIHLVPPGESDLVMPVATAESRGTGFQDPRTGKRITEWKHGDKLDRGDLIANRVKRGAPDYDPWRLEALGRDREYRAWRFETEEAARAASDLVARMIVVPPVNEDGEPGAVTDEDFARALRLEAEIEAELANEPPDDESLGERR